jgi:transposase
MDGPDTPSLSERAVAERLAIEAQLRRRDLAPRLRERLEMVKAIALGQDVATIAVWSGRSVARIRYWLTRYHQHGVGALADAPRSGRPPKADVAYLTALDAAMAIAPRDRELMFDVWTSERLSAYLAEQTAIRIAPGWLRVLLARREYACGRPKHTLKHLQADAAIAAFETELAQVGEKDRGRAAAARTPLSR